jgi:ABC-type transporter Mla subunit MlaD
MEKSKKQKINVSTLPNGYCLKIDEQEYMYFNVMELLAGFMVHVGMQKTDYQDKGDILTMLFQTMVGHEWEHTITSLNSRVQDLEDRLGRTINHLEATAKTGDRMEPRINELDEAIKTLYENLEKQKKENRQSLMDVRESSQTAKETAAEFKKQSKELKANIATIDKYASNVRKICKDAETHTKTVEILERRLENIFNTIEKHPKKGGSRKKNDAAVLAELEKQSKENPNII